MKLIRCNQCMKEIHEFDRHWVVELENTMSSMSAYGRGGLLGTAHLCSESCAADWFKALASKVTE